MAEDMTIAKMCAPTLAGIKTGSLYCYRYDDREKMLQAIREWNRKLSPKGVILVTLRFEGQNALIYAFRPKQLRKDFRTESVAKLLREFGYNPEKKENCIATLIGRITDGQSFPHEIGLFLGYPPEDVKGFIENRAGGYKAVGCWKVYGDETEAKRKFEAYRRCTNWFMKRLSGGERLERLTVMI